MFSYQDVQATETQIEHVRLLTDVSSHPLSLTWI
jgi:hypothetical protein